MGNTFVHIGPSLPSDEVLRLLPPARIRPPVHHGDLLALNARPGDKVLIIDGLFLHAAPVRHREILYLLEQGVIVAGASSMGALRAAELWQFGMRGVGEIFRLYRDGTVTGDDEVAIVHGPAEDGFRPLSEPLVNMRIALREAASFGVLTSQAAADLLELARDIPFRSRSYRALQAAARDRMPVADAFFQWARQHAVDTKAADARLLLAMAAADDPALAPHGPDDLPIANLRTHHMRSWLARFTPAAQPSAGSAVPAETVGPPAATWAQVVATVMLTHPAYPAEHRRQVLAELVGCRPDDSTVEECALHAARERGLDGTGHAGSSWLSTHEHDLPEPERLLRTLYRAFGAGEFRRLRPSRLPASLDVEPILAVARDVVTTAHSLNGQLPQPDPHRPRLRFRTQVIERVFSDLWECEPDEFRAAVWDRGFAHLEAFWLAAEPLVGYLKVAGPPEFPSPVVAAMAGR